jgi:AraC-like DNA-binding protein
MRYQEYAPGPRLARWVHCFWVLEGTGPALDAILPDGRMEMVLHFGEPFRGQPRSFLVGQQRRPVEVEPIGRVGVMGVRFRPGGACAFLGFPQHEATDRMIPLDAIWGVAELEEQVAEARSDSDRVASVEGFLLGRLRERWTAPAALEAAVARIFASRGSLTVEELAAGRPRQLGESFRQIVGISPKLLSRLVRFQEVLRRMAGRRWVWTALECGYYDQAHLIRDFREFAGQSPGVYAAGRHPLGECFVDGSDFSNTGRTGSGTL